jgi:CubicO group peptidase (beta-lactamase class C family)
MKTRLILIVLLGVLVAALALIPLVQPVQAASRTGRSDFATIDNYVQAQLDESRIPGLALGIVQGAQIVHLKGFGRANDSGSAVTPQTPFLLGSLSKSFTALAVMQLVEAGKIELDAPIARYLTWFRVADPTASARITVRQLLNQTSGLSTDTGRSFFFGSETETLEQAVRDLRTVELVSPVGTSFNYSNANYIILGLLVQTVSQEPYEVYIQQHIFQPLDMRHSYTSQEQARRAGMATGYRYWFGFPVAFDAPYLRDQLPAGYIISTAEDMSHYLAMYLGNGRYGDKVLLSPAVIAQMEDPAVPVATGTYYGMGWFVTKWGGVDALYHGGDVPNFHTGMVLVPHGNWGIIILENVNSASPLVSPRLLAIEQSVTGLVAGGQGATGTGIGTTYLVFDLVVAVVLIVQGWSLLRLLLRRRRLELPLRGLSHALGQGRRWILPLLWEVGGPVAIFLGVPRVGGASWGVMLLFAPDLSYALIAIGGIWLLTGLVRLVKAGLSLRAQQAKSPAVPKSPALPGAA